MTTNPPSQPTCTCSWRTEDGATHYACKRCFDGRHSKHCKSPTVKADPSSGSMTMTDKQFNAQFYGREYKSDQRAEWEEEFRARYEGANVWSSKSIDEAIAEIRKDLDKQEEIDFMDEDCSKGGHHKPILVNDNYQFKCEKCGKIEK